MDQELLIDTEIIQADELHQRMETDYIDYRGAIIPESESADADWSNEERRS